MANRCDFRRCSRAFADVMPWRSMLGSAAADIAKNVGNPLEVAFKNPGTASKMVSFHELSGNMMVIEWYTDIQCIYVNLPGGAVGVIKCYLWILMGWIPWDSNKLPNAGGNSPCFGCFNQICMRYAMKINHRNTSWVSSVGYNLPGMVIFWVIVVFHLSFFLDVCFSAFLLYFTSFFAVLLICFWAYLLICFSFLLFLVFYLSSLNKHQETLYVNTP